MSTSSAADCDCISLKRVVWRLSLVWCLSMLLPVAWEGRGCFPKLPEPSRVVAAFLLEVLRVFCSRGTGNRALLMILLQKFYMGNEVS